MDILDITTLLSLGREVVAHKATDHGVNIYEEKGTDKVVIEVPIEIMTEVAVELVTELVTEVPIEVMTESATEVVAACGVDSHKKIETLVSSFSGLNQAQIEMLVSSSNSINQVETVSMDFEKAVSYAESFIECPLAVF
ncbi:hypothetical protein [Providencia sp.]|uniref:hypothetical protein n=1 Tax=Providencia sp. TaxID=589 RepID=UPI003F97C7D0